MAEKLKSIFGAYADQLQLVIDRSQDRFAPTWYPNYFTFAPPQVSLDFTSVIGASRIEAAASIVSRDSETPLRSRGQLSKLSGSIPAIKEMFKMTEDDYRNYEVMQRMPVPDTVKRDQMLDFIFNDTLKVRNSVFKRLDYLVLQGLSTGYIDLNATNNPDGIVLTEPLDLLMPDDNKIQAATSWDSPATATPIKDIQTVTNAAEEAGRTIEKILMSKLLWQKFIATKQVIDTLTAFFYGPKPGAGFNPIGVTTLDNINEFLSRNELPVIELVNQKIGIETDGKIASQRPFSDVNAVFVPSGQLGTIKNAIAIEQLHPVASVSYATSQGALISKWSANEPFGEWTKAEGNMFPSFDAIDSIFHLKAIF